MAGERHGLGMLCVNRPLEDPGGDGRIILRWIYRKWAVGAWTKFIWLRRGASGRHL
jgi:hypothetical protein